VATRIVVGRYTAVIFNHRRRWSVGRMRRTLLRHDGVSLHYVPAALRWSVRRRQTCLLAAVLPSLGRKLANFLWMFSCGVSAVLMVALPERTRYLLMTWLCFGRIFRILLRRTDGLDFVLQYSNICWLGHMLGGGDWLRWRHHRNLTICSVWMVGGGQRRVRSFPSDVAWLSRVASTSVFQSSADLWTRFWRRFLSRGWSSTSRGRRERRWFVGYWALVDQTSTATDRGGKCRSPAATDLLAMRT